MSYLNNPEIIANIRTVDGEGNEDFIGDKVCGITASTAKNESMFSGGMIELDLRDIKKQGNFVVRVDAEQFMQAVSRALLNRDK